MTEPVTYTEEEIASAQAEAMRTVPLPKVVEETKRILRRKRGKPGVAPRVTNDIRERAAEQARRRKKLRAG